jgi:DNA-binding CsgD family transcriptional regulator
VSLFVIVEGPEASWRFAVREAEASGAVVEDGFDGPYRPGRVVRLGRIASALDAQAALLAALGGHGIVAHATGDRAVIDRLVDDLRRLGAVDHRLGAVPDSPDAGSEVRQLLGLLAEGQSLGEAAAILGLSRRTADRRLAAARRALGTDRTTEAIARAARLGWLRHDEETTG